MSFCESDVIEGLKLERESSVTIALTVVGAGVVVVLVVVVVEVVVVVVVVVDDVVVEVNEVALIASDVDK